MPTDAYPPLRQWVEKLREEVEIQKAVLANMEGRLAVCESLMAEILRQKEGESEH